MPVNPQRVQSVFTAAAEVVDPESRRALVERECGDDIDLLERVKALLHEHDDPSSFLKHPAVGPLADSGSANALLQRDGASPVDLAFLEPSTRPDSLGRLSHYEVFEVLGQGGCGIVMRAFDDKLQRMVAIKVMLQHLASTSPARKRFLREARAAAQVRHENVVQIHAVEEQPLPFLVMEFVPGETLQQRIDRTGPFETVEVVAIGRQIAEALAAAHAAGLIHRDVKPANVLIEEGVGPQVKLTDFGLARAADDASLTQSGLIPGTPLYMAPEQARGEDADHRADLFSLGSVLYTMCTGRPPFRAANALAVLKRVQEETPRSIRAIIPEVPEWLCALIEKLQAKNPKDRFQLAEDVAKELRRVRNRATDEQESIMIPLTNRVDSRQPATASPIDVGALHHLKDLVYLVTAAQALAVVLCLFSGVLVFLDSDEEVGVYCFWMAGVNFLFCGVGMVEQRLLRLQRHRQLLLALFVVVDVCFAALWTLLNVLADKWSEFGWLCFLAIWAGMLVACWPTYLLFQSDIRLLFDQER
jgi:serine/threonine protein kinase